MSDITPRLVIADPSLKDTRGHHYTLSKRISHAAIKRTIAVSWWCHADGTFNEANIEAHGVFSDSMYDAYQGNKDKPGLITRLKRRLRPPATNDVQAHTRLARQLAAAIRAHELSSNDHILFHTADGMTYAALDLLLRTETSLPRPNMHVCTPYDPFGVMPNRVTDLSVEQVIGNWAARGDLHTHIQLYAENQRLAEHLSTSLDARIDALPLPALPIPERARDESQAEISAVYLGPARLEKGFHLLPDIIRRAFEFHDKGKLRFQIQCTPQIVGYNEVVLKAIEKLRTWPTDQVELIEDHLDDARYSELLEGADIVLMPYGEKEYRYRSSGIVTEALCAGCIIVATKNTYPASMLTPDNGIAAETPMEFGRGLAHITDNIGRYRDGAVAASEAYRRHHHADNYLERILSF